METRLLPHPMARLPSPLILSLAIATIQAAFAQPLLGGSPGSSSQLNSWTRVPVAPITIIPQTDFIPVSNIFPVVNVFPTEYNDYSWIVYGWPR
jgi:hypothetical protein